jgi:hypothetical protein
MERLPDEIVSSIKLYVSHPVADLITEVIEHPGYLEHLGRCRYMDDTEMTLSDFVFKEYLRMSISSCSRYLHHVKFRIVWQKQRKAMLSSFYQVFKAMETQTI